MATISNGTGSTILFVEKTEPFCWMDPTADVQFERATREIYAENGEFVVCLCGVEVTTISTYLLPDTLKNMFLINDQQEVDFFEDLSDEETVTENGPLFSEEEK